MYNKSLPPALTASAREARQAFYCNLCSKGYARIHDFEAHENSYDHQHKKRFQEMKAMQRASQRPANGESRESSEMTGIKPISLAGVGTGKAKPGFKKAGFKSAFGGEKPVTVPGVKEKEDEKKKVEEVGLVESSEDEEIDGEPLYDPARPTS
ncbi:hypothetical protein EX30DRAFT_212868 [Ascodesmis nigricans]|uniref:C2H2-type domain-containing protein n=1 Tax=Ascodesmis nigricans TaxID=341454 RepID=A0A4V3SIZ6_9PEZI|nr:hypothetical protein EX30DRAFT_212868 [Ascodesmis nigricans]